MSLSAWTHHQLLKATAPVNFSQGRLQRGVVNKQSKEVLCEMTRARESFLEQIGNPASVPEVVVRTTNEYIGLLIGLLRPSSTNQVNSGEYAPQYPTAGDQHAPQHQENVPLGPGGRARTALLFQWKDAISGKVVLFEDVQAEVICVLLNVGLWHCMHASRLQKSSKPEDDDAMKQIYHTMRIASSYFEHVANNELDRYRFQQLPGSAFAHDIDPRVVQCMAEQCLAEAQEVTTNRARIKGHLPSVIGGLALDERNRFQAAKKHVANMDKALMEDIWAYLDFKIDFYDALTNWANGEHLFKEERCGDSIRCYNEAAKKLEKCKNLAKDYTARRKKRKNLKSDTGEDVLDTDMFTSLEKSITKSLSKAKHEHSFIYSSQRIPEDLPELIPSKSLVQKALYEMPARSSLWADATLDESKIPSRGIDRAADLASSDSTKVKTGPHHASGVSDDSLCSIQ